MPSVAPLLAREKKIQAKRDEIKRLQTEAKRLRKAGEAKEDAPGLSWREALRRARRRERSAEKLTDEIVTLSLKIERSRQLASRRVGAPL